MAIVDVEFRNRLKALEERVRDAKSEIHVDGLLDSVTALVADCNFPGLRRNKNVENFLNRYAGPVDMINGCRLKADDFEVVKVIGRGAFGEVQLDSVTALVADCNFPGLRRNKNVENFLNRLTQKV
ncbi:rho-associated protein kinase 1-like [Liolophura sinensis]|uniref:rho-associated protein kinase 1-like n=1 Tax=Liolophura sinensis TaxID=3198878 RepID=UPI003158CC29